MTGISRISSALLSGIVTVAFIMMVHSPALGAVPEGLQMLEEPGEGAFNLVGDIETPDPAAMEARLVFNIQESGDCYSLNITGGKAKFHRIIGEEVTHIGTVGTLPPLPEDAETIPFTLQRRNWRMAFVWGDGVIARAYDTSLHDGKCGTSIEGGSIVDPMIQPFGGIFVTDDFVREEGAEGGWEPLSGKWEQRSLRTDDQADRQDADKSANAFSYLGTATGDAPAVAVTGYWFWDVYSVETALQPMGNGPVGLVMYAQDADSYLAIRWFGRRHEGGGRLQIAQVDDGEETILGETDGGFLVGQWYSLRAAVSEGRIHVWVDGELRLTATTDAFGQGRIGLYTDDDQGCFFDDVICGPWELFVESFDTHVPGKWRTLSGSFAYNDGAITADGGTCLAMAGRTDWVNYEYSANVHPSNAGTAGLIVAGRSPDEYCRMEWTETKEAAAGRARIVKVTPEGESVLAEAPLTVPTKDWHRAKATVQNGLLRLTVDGQVQVEALDLDTEGGAVGLVARDAPGARFDNAMVEMIPQQQSSRVLREFTDTSEHFEMVEWASTRAPWVKPDEDENIWWTKGEYFGDHALVFPISDIGNKSGQMTLILGSRSPSADEKRGWRVTADVEKGSKDIALTILRGDTTLATGTATAEQEKAKLTVQRRSRWLIVLLDDKPVLHADMTASGQQAEPAEAPEKETSES